MSGHIGSFHADAASGVTRIVNGNSGKSPSGTPDRGGFTGWTMLGIDPPRGVVGTAPRAPDDRIAWLVAETMPRVDALKLTAPDALTVNQTAVASAALTQDGTRTVPVAWPVSARWGGAGVRLAGESTDAVVEFDPATGRLTALREGTATLRVTVNQVTSEHQVHVKA